MIGIPRLFIDFITVALGLPLMSIGGLPGIPRWDQYPPESLEWVPWGGSQLKEEAFKDSQEAFDQENYQQAYKTLTTALKKKDLLAKIQTADERAQLYNNIAVLLAKLEQFDEAYEFIEKAMQENPTIEEVIDAVEANRVVIESHLS